MAVRAPGPRHDGQDDLALEARILIRDELAAHVREFEGEFLLLVADGRMSQIVVGLGKTLRPRDLRPIREVFRSVVSVALFRITFGGLAAIVAPECAVESFVMRDDLERPIRPRCNLDHPGARAVKMTEHPLAILERAAVRTGVSIDTQNRSGDVQAALLHDEPKRLLALGRRRSQRDLPGSGD